MENAKPRKAYQCQRCGAETKDLTHVLREYCACCGVFGYELRRVVGPSVPEQPENHHLPALV
jgi:ribosomal protein L37E